MLYGQSVALLAEGVDRNLEIKKAGKHDIVALLAEGVDRNTIDCLMTFSSSVALLAEGVDRNDQTNSQVVRHIRRPPRGGRG